MHTHSPAEWAAFLSLGTGLAAAFSVPYFLLVDADRFAWPDLSPLLENRAGARLLVEMVRARRPLTSAVPEATDDRSLRRVHPAGTRRTHVLLDPLPQRGRPTRRGGLLMPNCDCGAADEFEHLPECIRYAAHEQWDIADEVALTDGHRPLAARGRRAA